MSSVVQNMLDNVLGDGARASKFDVMINFNTTGLYGNEQEISTLVKSTQFPGKSVDVIDLHFKGRTIPVKGQVKYDNTWSCTFYLTQDHKLKKAFEDWIESLDQQHNIKAVSGFIKAAQQINNSVGYTTTLHLAQCDFHGSQETVVYDLKHCFPKSVSAVEVDYSTVGTVLEFTVEFSYAYFDTRIVKVAGGSFIDDITAALRGLANQVIGKIKDGISSVLKEATSGVTDAISETASEIGDGIMNGIKEIGTYISGPDDMKSKMN